MFEQFIPVLMVLGVAARLRRRCSWASASGSGRDGRIALKDSTYECGIPVRGTIQIRFFVRFFLVALFFLLFDLEAVFLYPWVHPLPDLARRPATGAFALAEMGVFVIVLAGRASSTSGRKAAWNGSRPRTAPATS